MNAAIGGSMHDDVTPGAIVRAIEESPSLVIAIDDEGRLRYVNQGGARSLGYAVDELRGQPWDALVHPDDVAPSRWLMEEVPTTRVATEGRWRAADGSYRRILWNGMTLDGILYAIGMVIADRGPERAPSTGEAARLLETERLANVGSFERHTATGENHWSEGLRRILGVEAGHPLDFESGVLPLVHPEDRPALGRARDQAVKSGQELDTEFRIVRGDGEVRVLHVRATFEITEGRVARALGVVHDVTEQRRIQADLAHAHRMEAIGRLTGSVAHDFNNIIAGISGSAELGLQGGLDAEVAMREIVSLANQAAELTGSLLRFRVDADGHDTGDLCAVVRGHGPLLDRLVGDDVDVTVHTHGEGFVPLSDSQLSRVLVNLVVNADDAIPGSGEIRIDASIDDVGGVLMVEDTGVGMPGDVADRAFEPFFTTKPVGKGVGLGLSTVYAMVTQHGGTVRLDTEPGRGTRVRIELPAVSRIHAPVDVEPTPHVPDSSGQTVLVVDDTPAVLRVATVALENAGYRVLGASDPDQAIALSASHEGDIALVLTDVVMPAMAGPALVEQLRRHRPAIDVLYMSGYPQPGMWGVGMDDLDAELLQKPFGVTDLVARVDRVLQQPPP